VGEDFLIPATVLLEAAWVLQSSYRFDREQLAAALRMVVDLPHAIHTIPNLIWAIDRLEYGGDFADMLHIATISGADCFATFDRKVARHGGAGAPITVETLA